MDKNEIIVVVLALALLSASMLTANFDTKFTGFSVSKSEKVIVNVVDKENKPLINAKIYLDDLNDKKGRGYAFVSRTKSSGNSEFQMRKGEYGIQVSKQAYNIYSSKIEIKKGTNRFTIKLYDGTPTECIDGTTISTCSPNRPYFCNDRGILKPDCFTCGCGIDQVCNIDGWCS